MEEYSPRTTSIQCPPSATRLHANPTAPRPLTHSHQALEPVLTQCMENLLPLLANGRKGSLRTWSPHEPLRGQNLAEASGIASNSPLPPPPPPSSFLPLMETVLRLSNAQE